LLKLLEILFFSKEPRNPGKNLLKDPFFPLRKAGRQEKNQESNFSSSFFVGSLKTSEKERQGLRSFPGFLGSLEVIF
jgi:hypothetical protein